MLKLNLKKSYYLKKNVRLHLDIITEATNKITLVLITSKLDSPNKKYYTHTDISKKIESNLAQTFLLVFFLIKNFTHLKWPNHSQY